MAVVLAAAPIIVVLVALGILRWSAAVAGAAAFLIALVLSLVAFDLTAGVAAPISQAAAAAGALGEALHSAATILWIIFPALSIYELQRRTGAIDRIRKALVGLTDDRRIQAILIAWFFGLFMEGAAGFGTPVALAAPLLVGLGFAPVRAVALALIGHAAGVSFGAVGTPVFAQVEVSGLPAGDIAVATAGLHAVLGMILVVFLVRLAGKGPLDARDIGWGAVAGLCFFAPYLGLAIFAGPELPTLGGALLGAVLFVAILRRRQPGMAAIGDPGRLLADLAPYLVILVLVLATRLVPLLQEYLSGISLGWSLHETFRGSFQPLYHPGTMLLLGFLLGGLATGRSAHLGPAALAAMLRLAPVAMALVAMLAMSRLMVHAGMIEVLAGEAARTGGLWPLLAPAVGALGTFVTGSATASNVLFTEFQVTTASALSLPAIAMVAAQGFGAAIGNIIAPHNIIAGAAAVNLKGREGDILAMTASAFAIYVAAGGVALLVYAALH
jgi:lactate permease